MIIPVRLPSQVPSPTTPLHPILATIASNETAIIEFQGSIETEGEYSGQSIASLDMSIPAKPTLRIGHHLLEGKIVSLPKPMAVLKTVPNPEEGASSPIAFDITAIIRKKIVFSKRPSPMVGYVSDVPKEPAKRIK